MNTTTTYELIIVMPVGPNEVLDYILDTILVKSVGMDMADFAAEEYPMALEWKGLPCAPRELIATKKKIIHSTRHWEDLDEAKIRKFFRDLRYASSIHGLLRA